uniref:HTH cro/C1-type domain-containing protein n=1 Tax=Thermogemmatispora argillosa TaxID=2045280 RepID=A0A455T1N4_9CHLR|nr:hypothetical protein KTA_14000 [Thermogemmatispora argillosa]
MDQIGRLIREYRERAGMTQSELAARWPRHARFGGGEGVNWKYIQDIEHGRKRIEDQTTLRKVCALLNIPLWRVGLSEYDPLSGVLSCASPFTRCFDLMELTLRQIWQLRKAALLREARQVLARLGSWLDVLQQELPPLQQRDQARFGHLLADYHCLRGVLAVDAGQYQQALAHYQQMEQLARQLNDPAVLAHALMNLGVEYDRRGELQRGIQYLEEACDFALEASKAWSVLVHSYLSRAYARAGEERRFLRANDTALRLSHVLAKNFIEDPD